MPMPTETKAEKFIFAQAKGFDQAGELAAVASTGALDRDNEIIEPEAWLMEQPRPLKAASAMRPSSRRICTSISSPHRGLYPSAATSGSASLPWFRGLR